MRRGAGNNRATLLSGSGAGSRESKRRRRRRRHLGPPAEVEAALAEEEASAVDPESMADSRQNGRDDDEVDVPPPSGAPAPGEPHG